MNPAEPSAAPAKTIRSRLACLVLACVLPVWLCAAGLVYFVYDSKREIGRRFMLKTSQTLIGEVERELAIVTAALQALSTSPALATDDLAAFRRQVHEVLAAHPGVDIIMADATGQQVLNSALPSGSPLPLRNIPEAVRTVFATGKPYVSGVFKGAVSKRPLISVDFPVIRDGRTVYDLAMTVPVSRFEDLLAAQALPEGWMASLLDDANVVVTRTLHPDKSAGKPLGPSAAIARFSDQTQGIFESISLEGVPFQAGFSRSAAFGWSVVVGVPKSIVMAELLGVLGWTVGALVLLSVLGLWLAGRIGSGLARSIASLVPAARALGDNRPPAVWPQDLKETAELAGALESASRLLDQRLAERQRAETLRQAAEDDLRERERVFRIVADNSYNFEYWAARDGVFQWVSPACLDLTGYAPDEMTGPAGLTMRDLVHPEDRQAFADQLQAGLSLTPPKEIQLRLIRKDGGVSHIAHVCSPLLTSAGSLTGWRGVGRDVSEQKRHEEALRAAKEAADAATRTKSQFLASMSHEIRTPLNAVFGMLQLLRTTSLSEEQAEYLGVGLRATERLSLLLSDILDLAKVESGQIVLRLAAFAVDELTGSIMEIFGHLAAKKGLNLSCQTAPDLPDQLLGDVTRIRQILFNLVGNAVKYTDSGHVTLTLAPGRRAAEASEPFEVVFTVSDSGRGIPGDKLAHIFEPFVQTGEPGESGQDGVGLGLTIVKRLCELMGASIEAMSQPGQGTAIRVRLPLALPKEDGGQDGERAGPDKPARSLSVLVAEDDQASRFTFLRMLRKAGHRAEACANGREALDKLKRDRYDCLLLDIRMPVMDGLEAARCIRSDNSGAFDPDIPIIAVTAQAMAGDSDRVLASGVSAYLAKPVDALDLASLLGRVTAA